MRSRGIFARTVVIGLACALSAMGAAAVQPGEMLADKALEARARKISTEIRCLVCQNQSIDDSDAPLAHDLRMLVRGRLQAGDSDEQVRDFVVSRYGAFVLLRPPVNGRTFLLWFGPLLVLLAAIAGLLTMRGRTPPPPEALTEEEEARLAAILAKGEAPQAGKPAPQAAHFAPNNALAPPGRGLP